MPRTIQQGCLPHTQDQRNTLQSTQRFRITDSRRSQWSRGLRRVCLRPFACWDCRFESGRGHGCRECCVLSGRYLCVWLITRTEGYYQVWCVCVRSWRLDEVLADLGLLLHWRGGDYPLKTIEINGSFDTSDAIKSNFKFEIHTVNTLELKKNWNQNPTSQNYTEDASKQY